MEIIKSFDIRNLLPFHKPGKGVPRSVGGAEEKIAELDPNLSPEEQIYVGHYVGYADILLSAADPQEKPMEEEEEIIKMPAQTNQEPGEAEKAKSQPASENEAA